MKTIVVEKYVNGNCVEKYTLPLSATRLFARFLPNKAIAELQSYGINIKALLDDTSPSVSEQWLDVEEHSIIKKIRISRGVT
ncbi:hypothetical protein [Brucella pseudogrignonensis]|uniref:Uncharacterized protein n=1 Tax=Brucella pseudogrignonensis TaxID=419475 RepID=A0ABU1MF89_9HYPH|nr:hypothetical protein [Brucella pseudogrignonensis]MDR6434709.1 hypothetical protein [Brucella pseudogrignonensis]